MQLVVVLACLPSSAQGSTFKHEILSAMDNNTFFREKMLPYNASSEGGELYASYLESAQAYPDYLDEIRGMADGAELSFSEVKVLAMHSIMSFIKMELQILLGRYNSSSSSCFETERRFCSYKSTVSTCALHFAVHGVQCI